MTRLLSLLFVALISTSAIAADRPNVVWIVSEDNSHHYLDHFFDGGAKTPNIKALADHGLTFDKAFSNAPVCSVARTTLATSCYGPRIGTQFHRRYRMVNMPGKLKMFSAYLKNAGYYTTNNSKTDYNAIASKDVWDESSRKAGWENRPNKSQPFFHMQSHANSHEGSLHFPKRVFENEKTKHDPANVKLADYHPDTPLFRYTHARYLDNISKIDDIVGQTVAKLKAAGVLEDTFVFYFGDHGGVLPRGKGYIYESGLHVPLVIRVPKNFRSLVDAKLGSRHDGFVSFVDFGPTVLNLAGVKIPDGIDGRPFLGKGISMSEVNSRDEAFGYADRFDEKYDLVRSIRKGKYQYIRNYQPYLPDGLMNIYRYKMLAFQQWREHSDAGKLNEQQNAFFQRKPTEALFDCEADPHQVNNLADDPQHAQTLKTLRRRLQTKMKSLPDLSLYPESYLAANAFDNPAAFGQTHKAEIAQLLDTLDLQLLSFDDAKPKIVNALSSDNAMIRAWAAVVCTSFGKQAASLSEHVKPLLKDQHEIVRVRAVEFLGSLGVIKPQDALIKIVNETDDEILAVEALNSVVWFKDFFNDRHPIHRSEFTPKVSGGDVDDRLNYINGVPYPKKKKPRKKQTREPAAAR